MSLKLKNLIGFGCSIIIFLLLLITFLYIGFGIDYSSPKANGGSVSQSVYYKGWGFVNDIANAGSLKYGNITTDSSFSNSITILSIIVLIISFINCIYFGVLFLTSMIGREIDKPVIKRVSSLVICSMMLLFVILFIAAVAHLTKTNLNFAFSSNKIENGKLSLAPITYISFIFIIIFSVAAFAPAVLLV